MYPLLTEKIMTQISPCNNMCNYIKILAHSLNFSRNNVSMQVLEAYTKHAKRQQRRNSFLSNILSCCTVALETGTFINLRNKSHKRTESRPSIDKPGTPYIHTFVRCTKEDRISRPAHFQGSSTPLRSRRSLILHCPRRGSFRPRFSLLFRRPFD